MAGNLNALLMKKIAYLMLVSTLLAGCQSDDEAFEPDAD